MVVITPRQPICLSKAQSGHFYESEFHSVLMTITVLVDYYPLADPLIRYY